MDWQLINTVNLLFVFINLYVAIWCFKNGNDFGGNLNMMAVLLNAWFVANKLMA